MGRIGVCIMGHVYIINCMYIPIYIYIHISEHSYVISTYSTVYRCNMLFMFLTKNSNVYEDLRHILSIEITVLFLNGLSAIKNNSHFSTKIL